ncbi:DUF2281 domain-containing protein [Microcystis aeruginosa]|uniref:DUF2281 domain-containing protein n=1 Tax=Microcystis aeruginosa 11-30S32 TaxID=2358142 RepID=A0A510PQ54_MICAE|nr:DUF2281 domain-containing protein [Microcystis aeruginosa]GCA96008.1 hypothetical protein MAE30S32_46600 [Microcystis aeruginosa 11-30S32]
MLTQNLEEPNIEQAVIKNLRKLPLEKQQEVLSFTESLIAKTSLPLPEPTLTPEQRAAKWMSWVQSHSSNNPPLPDEALHRDLTDGHIFQYKDKYCYVKASNS